MRYKEIAIQIYCLIYTTSNKRQLMLHISSIVVAKGSFFLNTGNRANMYIASLLLICLLWVERKQWSRRRCPPACGPGSVHWRCDICRDFCTQISRISGSFTDSFLISVHIALVALQWRFATELPGLFTLISSMSSLSNACV